MNTLQKEQELFAQNRADIYIGIDPDVKKSGVAFLERYTRTLAIYEFGFFELFEFLCDKKRRLDMTGLKVRVILEGGWLNESNWHLQAAARYVRQPLNRAAAIGYNTGENHRTGKLIGEMCQFIGVECNIVKPLQKCWHGKEGKITHAELEYLTGMKLKRTNQDGRDAALLAWVAAGFPVRVMPKR